MVTKNLLRIDSGCLETQHSHGPGSSIANSNPGTFFALLVGTFQTMCNKQSSREFLKSGTESEKSKCHKKEVFGHVSYRVSNFLDAFETENSKVAQVPSWHVGFQ